MARRTTVFGDHGLVRQRSPRLLAGSTASLAVSHRETRRRAGAGRRQIFPNLSCAKISVATAANRSGGDAVWTLDTVLDLFPALASGSTASARCSPAASSRCWPSAAR